MRVLLTRPRADSERLARRLEGYGIESVIEPVMDIVPTDAVPDLDGVQAVLLTSANGARALAQKIAARDLPVYAVGDATARAARDAGFSAVESAGGDVEALAALVVARLKPDDGVLFHPAGTHVAGDLAGALGRHGYTVRRAVLYQAKTAERLSDAVCARISEGTVDGALFFSPRTAQTFVILVEQAGLAAACAKLDAFCLSAAVAQALEGPPWRSVRIAETPETGALLGALEAWVSQMNAGC